LCFKCGSLEHTAKDCRSTLKREQAYRYAVCFICKESGHLAKACPDNPRGLYPKVKAKVKYGVRSSKLIWAPCAQLYLLIV
jgi:hypothetical protein